MTENPYQDVIDWLNDDEGERWLRSKYRRGMWAKGMYSIKDDTLECGPCARGASGDDHYETMKFQRAANLVEDGPNTEYAKLWVRGMINDIDFSEAVATENGFIQWVPQGVMTGSFNG